jgi:hypothetical protein
MLLSTSFETKWAVIPTMVIMATILRPRDMRKVFARGAEEAIFAFAEERVVAFFGCRCWIALKWWMCAGF